jgi:hypothetical protein
VASTVALAASIPFSWLLRLLPLMGLWSMAWRLLARFLAQRCRAFARRIRWRGCRRQWDQLLIPGMLVTATADTAGG